MRPTHRLTRRTRHRVRIIPEGIREHSDRVAAPLRRGVLLAPATITSIGLLSGFYSAISSIGGHFELAAVMIMIAFICDGLDGRVARLSRTSSQFGIEYDSLSDVVAFGMAPAILAFTWALHPIGGLGVAVSGLFVVCAALRLARFNVQTASVDKRRFVGLPVPGAAAMVAGIALAYSYFELNSPKTLCSLMVPITLALAGLMISRVPYPSFKGINLHKRAQIELMIGAVVGAAFLVTMPQVTVFLLASAFVLSGPYLMLRGERMPNRVAMLPVEAQPQSAPASSDSPRTYEVPD
ncbi:MAG: CDP-diacylglycerol--serine O-phosphatidyltransferase [Deltaproteobacteria bacterium]|nr:CDP-diacylglycerol--serine O-phosphatidyltransferase [Deltaproteobacteria bacterium]